MKYKQSFYNIHSRNPEGHIVYNTLYNSLVRLTDSEYAALCFQTCADKELEEEFIANGLWVGENIDETDRYINLSKLFRNISMNSRSITIATTMKCNARCKYCYEQGIEPKDISAETEAGLLSYINSLPPEKNIDLTWIGGEPLLNTGVIDNISSALKTSGRNFRAYIITNGSLITSEIIHKMKNEWNIAELQITLDGVGDEYEKRKNYCSQIPYFKKILRHITELSRNGIYVHIRMNIDRDNAENIVTLAAILKLYYCDCDNVFFYPAFLSGSDCALSDREKVDLIGQMLADGVPAKKLTINSRLHSKPKIRPCMICDPYSMAVDTNGCTYNCDRDMGQPEKSAGNISGLPGNTVAGEFHLDNMCVQCKFLPKCFGGCTSDREQGECFCFIDKYLIQAYIETL